MSVDIIITTYNKNVKKVSRCLSAIIENTKFVDYKIYLLANEPNEKMKTIIHNSMYIDGVPFTDRIVPIYQDTNDNSFSENNNSCAEEGDGKYILLLNDDCYPVFNSDWLLNMTRILDTDPKVGVVGALLLYPDKKIQHCGVFFSKHTNNLPFHMHYKQSLDNVKGYISQYRRYQAVTGACMLVRRSDFESVGKLDELFYYNFEDVSLCLNIQHKLKKSCVYCPQSVLIHDEGVSSSQNENTEHNVKTLREKCAGMYFNDLHLYQENPNYNVYKPKF